MGRRKDAKLSRFKLRAMAQADVCKGENGHIQGKSGLPAPSRPEV